MKQAVESQAFRHAAREHEADAFGMWIFIGSEAMLFGAIVLVFLIARIDHPKAFGDASSHLSLTLGTANTAILIGSSFLIAVADERAKADEF